MTRKIIFCFLFLLIAMIFTSCSMMGKVTDSQLYSDIEKLDKFQEGYYCRYVNATPFKVKKVEIERRQTTPKDRTDYILCNVEAENEHFAAEFTVNMHYSHYDAGGWVLSYGNAEIQSIVPISGVDAAEIPSITVYPNYQNMRSLIVELNSENISDIILENNRCIIKYHYENDFITLNGYSTTYFENGDWNTIYPVNFETTDFNINWLNVSYETREYERRESTRFYEFNTEKHYEIGNTTYVISSTETGLDWYDINFISYDPISERITGELIINAGSYAIRGEEWHDVSYEQIILTIPFDTLLDKNTGKFIVSPYVDELETYVSSNLWFLTPCEYFTTADCHAEITYNFAQKCWEAEFFVDSLCNNPIKVKEYTKSLFGFSRT